MNAESRTLVAVPVLGRLPESLPLNTGLEVVMRADEVARFSLEQENLRKADLIVTRVVEALDFGDFSNPGQRIALGERAARKQREAMRELVERFESMFVRALPGADAEPRTP